MLTKGRRETLDAESLKLCFKMLMLDAESLKLSESLKLCFKSVGQGSESLELGAEDVEANAIFVDDYLAIFDALLDNGSGFEVINGRTLVLYFDSHWGFYCTIVRKLDGDEFLVGVADNVEVASEVDSEVVEVARNTRDIELIFDGEGRSADSIFAHGEYLQVAGAALALTHTQVEFVAKETDVRTTVRTVDVEVVGSRVGSSSVELEVNNAFCIDVCETAVVYYVCTCRFVPETTFAIVRDAAVDINRHGAGNELRELGVLRRSSYPFAGGSTDVVTVDEETGAVVCTSTCGVVVEHEDLEIFTLADEVETCVGTCFVVAIYGSEDTLFVERATQDRSPGLEVSRKFPEVGASASVVAREEDTAVAGDTNTIRRVGGSEGGIALERAAVAVRNRREGRVERINALLVNGGVVALVGSGRVALGDEETAEVRRERIVVDVYTLWVVECVVDDGGVGGIVENLTEWGGGGNGIAVNADAKGVGASRTEVCEVDYYALHTGGVVSSRYGAYFLAVAVYYDFGSGSRRVEAVLNRDFRAFLSRSYSISVGVELPDTLVTKCIGAYSDAHCKNEGKFLHDCCDLIIDCIV